MHSHLSLQHLLKQLEIYQSKRNLRERRPAWLIQFIQQAAVQFEPLQGSARVGSECELQSTGWEVRLFLGSTELVGGKDDGAFQVKDFEIPVDQLLKLFTRTEKLTWSVFAMSPESQRSFLTLSGYVTEKHISTGESVNEQQNQSDLQPASRALTRDAELMQPATPQEHALTLKIYSRPPLNAAPAFRQHVNGPVVQTDRIR